MSTQTEIRYKCYCMPAEVSLFVPARTPQDHILVWMHDIATKAITEDHKKRCPTCTRDRMEYAKILIGNHLIGGPPTIN